MGIRRATGATIQYEDLKKDNYIYVKDYISSSDAVSVTEAINRAIVDAADAGGGTIVFTRGEYRVYTIELKSNVNLLIEKNAIIYAAKTDVKDFYFTQKGEGGNYLAPEVNLYTGLQDHGHTYFANSLIYGADIENVMIYGEGLIDGSTLDDDGYLEYVLQGGDPDGGYVRNGVGHRGMWFGNKAVALVRCNNVVLKDFSLVIGGHFAIITEGVTNMLIDSILVDTTRDALDVDCCQDVTIRNSIFNSLTDDALVIKASYGAGVYMPSKNILVEDCIVSGYDAKSVYMKKYTCDKLVAEDRCRPTGRVKLGTESTCGYEQVTIRRVRFDHSRGFALEAVDGSPLSDIIFTDCIMTDVSSSPIFLRVGDRARYPVTGYTLSQQLDIENDIRIDNKGYIIPDLDSYTKYYAKRYVPSYNRSREVTVDGKHFFTIVDEKEPANVNMANIKEDSGKYYVKVYDEKAKKYDYTKEIDKREIYKYSNGVGCEAIASIKNIEISNVVVKNADGRYPIIIAGLVDSIIKNVTIKNISLEYTGGIHMNDAVEQRQLNTCYAYTQYKTKEKSQIVPWMVNTFFCKNECLLPRVDYNVNLKKYEADPYNVPEATDSYPEPSIFGILPAYGMYIRHAENITLSDIKMKYIVEDDRHPVVLDDVSDINIEGIICSCTSETEEIAVVKNNFKRHTNYEYIKDEPYITTDVKNISTDRDYTVKHVEVNAPAPGTPKDSLYPYDTVASLDQGYTYDSTDLPLTIIRPYFTSEKNVNVKAGEIYKTIIKYRDPASETIEAPAENRIYNESVIRKEPVIMGHKRDISVTLLNGRNDAIYDDVKSEFIFNTSSMVKGENIFTFEGDDGIMKFYHSLNVYVE